ncbi:MAG: ABC transporter permease [Acidimicrobiia bacterium]|nr:ABC transporter permease [Acidimicrobiia bacterium]MXZ85371.1 ABC transporter permease [Acidimicrobiia bacterium]MYE73065.1 ABC transporter permease [Acidimicrobiia bacterium]MYG73068.1 ABC transporter permease [Acidimicrobiia bacterium]MYH95552.1 ABC transporter permease [Acidimicrobiia bacterium]
MIDFFTAVGDVLSSESTYINGALFAALLAYAATGEWVAERSGTLNISVEGMLLSGAFAGILGYHISDLIVVGLVFGVIGGMLIAAVQAEMSHRLSADQFVVGLTLNILVFGLVGFLDREIEPQALRASTVEIPVLVDIPLIGQALFGEPWPFYLLYVLVPVSWWLVYRTRWGLELRAAGENPQSADVSGIDVNRRRRQSIYYAGFTSGLGGAYFLFARIAAFDDSVIGGQGFIAIAAVIFGGWTLWGTMAGCVLFAGALSFQLSLQGLGYELNTELLQALPYLVTIGAMAIFAKRVRPPAALARPFIRGLK